jgi:hypothetical protein
MKELQQCMMSTSFFLEDVALKYFAETGMGVRGFIVTKAMRDELANDNECMFFGDHEILIGADCWELYTSDYQGLMIIDMTGNVEAVK